MEIFIALAYCILGYLFGSLPFALWITKALKGIDVRDGGSFHATTTNTIRQAGWKAGGAVLILDIAKGAIPTLLAVKYAPFDWAIPVTAALAVVGHCWPVFAGFKGGMGLATTGGSVLVVFPGGFWAAFGALILMTLMVKHSAKAAIYTGIMLAPLFFFLGERGTTIWVGGLTGAVLAIRFMDDWNREYRELWLDREPKSE